MTDERPFALVQLDELPVEAPPVHDLLASGRALRRRRRGATASLLAAVVAVGGLAIVSAVTDSGTSPDDRAADPSRPTPTPLGCGGMTVASTDTEKDTLLLTLRNDGTAACDVMGLRLARDDVRGDTLRPADVAPGDALAEQPLPPGAALLITAATDTCQAAGLPLSVTFPDTSTLGFTFGERGNCLQPGFVIDITDVRSVTVDAGQQTAEPPALSVSVKPMPARADYVIPLAHGSAALWHERGHTLVMLPKTLYSSCFPIGAATVEGGTVRLTLTPSPDSVCATLGSRAEITISGLSERPSAVTITEDGETIDVPVVAPSD